MKGELIEVVNVTMVRTVAQDGDVRLWGACLKCAHVEELGIGKPWLGFCEACEDEESESRRRGEALEADLVSGDYHRAVAP